MPPPGYEPFRRAICDNPADDAPRLVFADWLDEHGDPELAEFIRVQVEHARRPETSTGCRQFALFDKQRQKWLGQLPQFRGVVWGGEFDRGFVFHAAFERPRAFLRWASRVREAIPLTSVTLQHGEDIVLRRLLEHPVISQLEALTLAPFSAHQSRRLWTAIAAAPRLANLRSLVIDFDDNRWLNWRSAYEFEAEWRWAITESPHLQRLEMFAPGTGEVYRDLGAVRRQGPPAPPAPPELPPVSRPAVSRPSPWQILRRALGIGDG